MTIFALRAESPPQTAMYLNFRIPLLHCLLTILLAGLVLVLAHYVPQLHLIMLAIVLASLLIGYVQGANGWILMLLFCILLWAGRWFWEASGWRPDGRPVTGADWYAFVVSPLPAFVGGLLGYLIRRFLRSAE
jgi:hypothetical protein